LKPLVRLPPVSRYGDGRPENSVHQFAGLRPTGFSGWQSIRGQGSPSVRCLRLDREFPLRTAGKK